VSSQALGLSISLLTAFSNAGGGGERVLWAAIRATQDTWPLAVCVVYTGDHDAEKNAIIKRVQDRFNITLNPDTLHFIYLSTRKYVLASTWPRFTLLGQSLGSLVLVLDAFNLLVPDIYIDTMGYAFTLALSKLVFPKVPTAAYVHYPTISTDMLTSLDDSTDSNRGLHAGAGSGWKGRAKKRYWLLFAKAYSIAGIYVDVVMANSTWTKNHIHELWGKTRGTRTADDMSVIFPPVAVTELEQHSNPAEDSTRLPHLLCIAQFRPEKNHNLIITAFAQLLASKVWAPDKKPKLVLVGSVRDRDDATRVYKLRLLAHELQIKEDVEFVCDASWPQVLYHLRSSSIGVNGMWNEHFGIGVVEYQASGLISVVNDSGGPKLDIVVDVDGGPTGKSNQSLITGFIIY
jgi:alpha-1,2-mannosyltransferase